MHTMTVKSATNEEILGVLQDLMQMTSEGLDRLDNRMNKLEGRLEDIDGEIGVLKLEVHDLKQSSYRQEIHNGAFMEIVQNTMAEQLRMQGEIKSFFDSMATKKR